jgi:hypothetical protein
MLQQVKQTGPLVAGGVLLVAAVCWVVAVRDRHRAELEAREWAAGQPSEIVRAGPQAAWAASCCPSLSGASRGLSVGASVKYYPGTLAESPASIIGWGNDGC